MCQLTARCQSGTHDPGTGVLKVNIPHMERVDHFKAGFAIMSLLKKGLSELANKKKCNGENLS